MPRTSVFLHTQHAKAAGLALSLTFTQAAAYNERSMRLGSINTEHKKQTMESQIN